MYPYQQDFLELSISQQVLRFGNFTLKSGRQSPYFFNAGLFNTGGVMAKLGRYYAMAIKHSGIAFDMMFGPAYKGIPLVVATAIALADHHQQEVPFGFNRKEVKDHGEGGRIVGAPLQGKVLLIDDVISAGTAIVESVQLIEEAGATLAGVVIALNRQERGHGERSAIEEVEQRYGVKVVSIVTLDHLIAFLEKPSGTAEILESIQHYRQLYGVSSPSE